MVSKYIDDDAFVLLLLYDKWLDMKIVCVLRLSGSLTTYWYIPYKLSVVSLDKIKKKTEHY